MTRLERIKFIRENSKAHTNTDFKDYDDDDIFKLYHRIPLPPDKADKRDREAGWLIYWWGRVADVLPDIDKNDGSSNFPSNIITFMWLILFNPVCLIIYVVVAVILLLTI